MISARLDKRSPGPFVFHNLDSHCDPVLRLPWNVDWWNAVRGGVRRDVERMESPADLAARDERFAVYGQAPVRCGCYGVTTSVPVIAVPWIRQ